MKKMKNLHTKSLLLAVLFFVGILLQAQNHQLPTTEKPNVAKSKIQNKTTMGTVTDIEGNVYQTVDIGDQTWMSDNLRTTKYNDGTEIPYIENTSQWTSMTSPAFCWWNHDSIYADTNNFGGLYNWYTVNTGTLCPTGWHVPSNEEWEAMVFYLAANGYNYDGTVYTGNDIVQAGSKIGKALAVPSGWLAPTYGNQWSIGKDQHLNNSSLFNGIGADGRYMATGVFLDAYYMGNWWTSTPEGTDHAWTFFIYTEEASTIQTSYFKQGGYSVRCIGDSIHTDFSADNSRVCIGNSVGFTDESMGNVTSWMWTFEGGTPATSTSQNPVVSYNSLGAFDVKLVISDGFGEDSLIKTTYISVVDVPNQANIPTGATGLCNTHTTSYATNSVQYAISYDWQVTPSEAGTISSTDTTANFESSNTFVGNYTIKVRAVNECDNGLWSQELQCELYKNPDIFQLTGDRGYCQGTQGTELILDSSETGFDYELYLDDVATGNIMAGTGAAINFGFNTDEGIYRASGYSASCFEYMSGNIWVHELFTPAQPSTPNGLDQVCNNDSTAYATTPDSDVSSYIWALSPTESGTLYTDHDSVSVKWAGSFSGAVSLSVVGENDCGTSIPSDPILIDVFGSPSPEVSGSQLVCLQEEADYQTNDNAGNSYNWEIMGGSIVAGNETHQVTVRWGDPGFGSVKVTEQNTDECTSTTETYEVTIDECTFINEEKKHFVSIYPNPANTVLNIELLDDTKGIIEIKVVNALGIIIESSTFEGSQKIYRLKTSSYEPGLYYLHINGKFKRSFVGKLMVSH
jgi:uncharacterized protein (TIGR02145 family)